MTVIVLVVKPGSGRADDAFEVRESLQFRDAVDGRVEFVGGFVKCQR